MSKANREANRIRRREEERLAKVKAKQRRRWSLIGALAGLVVIGVIVLAVWLTSNSGTTPPPAATPTATATATGTPSPEPAVSHSPLPTARPTAVPDQGLAQNSNWDVTMRTSAGNISMTLLGAQAPQAVSNFLALSASGFFDGTNCHRLTTSGLYVLQCGDPLANGMGGPGYTWGPIENAPADGLYPAGTLAMARSNDPNSMGSQFFLVYKDTTLPTDGGGYTVFGTITSGLDVLQAVADAGTSDGSTDGPPKSPVTIEGVDIK